MKKILLIIAVLMTVVSVQAQTISEADKTALQQLNSRVIEASNATKLSSPSYPAKAYRKGIGGKIPVKIWIDETGKIVDAKIFCGNSDLGKASVKTALKSKFTPALVDGKPTKSVGYILYIFDPTPRIRK